MQTTNSTKPRRPSGSVKLLAESLGISSRHCRDLLDTGMPLDPQAATAWRERKGTGDSDSAETLRLERIKLVMAQREKIQTENLERQKLLVPSADVREAMLQAGSHIKMALLTMANTVPPELEGLDAARIQKILRTAIMEILTHLSTVEKYQS